MFVKIFFTVNMFISIDYEVMISYVKEKKEISLHWANKLRKSLFKKSKQKNQISWKRQKRNGGERWKHELPR